MLSDRVTRGLTADAKRHVEAENLMSKYETMRQDRANWIFGTIYYCPDDPRLVVRNLLPFGWAWNFGHPKVYVGILLAIVAFLAPPCLAWQLGVSSRITIGVVALLALVAVVFVASRLAQDPEA